MVWAPLPADVLALLPARQLSPAQVSALIPSAVAVIEAEVGAIPTDAEDLARITACYHVAAALEVGLFPEQQLGSDQAPTYRARYLEHLGILRRAVTGLGGRGLVTALAAGYTRDQGFTAGLPTAPDLAAVVASAEARVGTDTGFTGWSLVELAILNRYRRRAG